MRTDDRMAQIVTLGGLDPEALTTLARDGVGALRVPGFFDEKFCEQLLAVGHEFLERYDRDQYPVVACKIGPALNEYMVKDGISPQYWSEADRVVHLWSTELRHLAVHDECHRLLTESWSGPVRAARVSGRPLFWGIVREISEGTLIHWDDVTQELQGLSIDPRPWAQLALNVFLSVPEQGGEAVVWLQRWAVGDESHRISFGYRPDVIRPSSPICTIVPHVGDAILFNARNYHTVNPGHSGRRVAFSAFVGLGDEMALWS
ncbi:hypothetical protein SAMN05444920_10169 [Nonomuraea solani]|uniref:2OG-Fe(II) oxygenase superfamily protein n=1 Tax=Nonomuraea solani TaxID=1144553 RepID=A0A1H5SZA9_9ACTN|nr:hypothetical protein [Nonomuraea solani]SEF55923.1 hypothetical protein SAMN05444920_10169 [Nonomuraea solani]